MEVVMPENGEKKLIRKLLIWSLGIIITLLSVIWGITWGATKIIVKENAQCNATQNERLASLEKGYETIEKRLDQIYEEVKDK